MRFKSNILLQKHQLIELKATPLLKKPRPYFKNFPCENHPHLLKTWLSNKPRLLNKITSLAKPSFFKNSNPIHLVPPLCRILQNVQKRIKNRKPLLQKLSRFHSTFCTQKSINPRIQALKFHRIVSPIQN